MAEYIMRAVAPKEWDLDVISCGTMTTVGLPPSDFAIAVSMEEGIDIVSHRSQPATARILRDCDLILTMTQGHKSDLSIVIPEVRDRVYCLKEFGEELKKVKDIQDPISGDLNVYRKCFREIYGEIKRIIPVVDNYLGLS